MTRMLTAIAVLVFTAVTAHAEPTTYLPVNHPVYDFLERLEQRFPDNSLHLGTKPLTRVRVAEYLYDAEEHREEMTPVERDELDVFLDEFAPDIFPGRGWSWETEGPYTRLPGFITGHWYRNERNLFAVRGHSYSLYFDPVFVRNYTYGKNPEDGNQDNVHTESNGFTLYGTVGEHLGYHIDVRDSREWGSRNYPLATATTLPGIGYASFKDDHAEYDETRAHILYTAGAFAFMLGRDTNVWGNGERSLMFSGYGAPYDMFRIDTSFWRLRFMYFAAEIEQYPSIAKYYYPAAAGGQADSVTVKKYLSGHRLEINITDRFTLGLHEAVVYGGRLEAAYLNPVIFIKGAEHANGDHDNALMGMDMKLIMSNSVSLYSELLIDDITTTKLGTDWYGNKLACQAGAYVVNPLRLQDTDFRIEYTRLNPWVYSHRFPIDSFTNYGDVLGHPAGPNSDEVLVALRKRFTRRLHTGITFTRYRHGNNTATRNVGGDPLDGFSPGDSKEAHFLAGDRITMTAVSATVSYEILWRLFLGAGITQLYRDGNSEPRYSLTMSFND